jgi:hypothetical protein
VLTDIAGSTFDGARAVVIDSQGRILLAGNTEDATDNDSVAVIRPAVRRARSNLRNGRSYRDRFRRT